MTTDNIAGTSREMNLQEWCDRLPKDHLANRELSALQARVEATEKDAARYRWLRTADSEVYKNWHLSIKRYDHKNHEWAVLDGDELDAAIDGVITKERET